MDVETCGREPSPPAAPFPIGGCWCWIGGAGWEISPLATRATQSVESINTAAALLNRQSLAFQVLSQETGNLFPLMIIGWGLRQEKTAESMFMAVNNTFINFTSQEHEPG
jgi:hypothetical protein